MKLFLKILFLILPNIVVPSDKPLYITNFVASSLCFQLEEYKTTRTSGNGTLPKPVMSRPKSGKCFCFEREKCIGTFLCEPFKYKNCKCPTVVKSNRVPDGSRITDYNKYPSFVHISFADSGYLRCGGVLISNFWVLSSARCFHGYADGGFNVYAGVVARDISSQPHLQQSAVNGRIVFHYEFENEGKTDNWYSGKGYNDLVQIPVHNFTMNKEVKAAEIAPWFVNHLRYATAKPREGWIVGFGDNYEGGGGEYYLREVKVTLWDLEQCQSYLQQQQLDWNKTTWICGTSDIIRNETTGPTPCWNDIGGPLYIKDRDGHMLLYGILSWILNKDSCGVLTPPYMFTQVTDHLQWIRIISGVRVNRTDW